MLKDYDEFHFLVFEGEKQVFGRLFLERYGQRVLVSRERESCCVCVLQSREGFKFDYVSHF
jgi:hypothetical protein